MILPNLVLNEKLENIKYVSVCGNIIQREMKFDSNLIRDFRLQLNSKVKVKSGKGLSVTHFHEALGLYS